jgi:hypothetical protein
MSARRFFNTKKKLSSSKLDSTNDMIEESTSYSTHHTRRRHPTRLHLGSIRQTAKISG